MMSLLLFHSPKGLKVLLHVALSSLLNTEVQSREQETFQLAEFSFFLSMIRAGLKPTAYLMALDKAAVFGGHSEDTEYWSIYFGYSWASTGGVI